MARFRLPKLSSIRSILRRPSSVTITQGAKGGFKMVTTYASSAGKTVLSWGNAAKVAVAGLFGYYILNGGLVDLTAQALGIPDWLASAIWVLVAIVLIALLIRYLLRLIRLSPGRAANKIKAAVKPKTTRRGSK